ncbi:ALUMINUM INDUCED PROTEIN WITH YGL AND LRDR MOTIFS [Salix koriyanagi]|uniref:ALUMINUM INDUCED PROTEIN WITH YGL AND LRDR MOTIFS n=1 Tax=Salix koriyanagi TaxID=2511006 RepID=A0A9Q0UYS6_9ROSI|nr:ALUMINUM INDUCED PROTEIN WITH YGL AND LRDR MOTIFS [Salix koriyanagi]
MLAIFNKGLVNPPQELYSPASLCSSRKPKLPGEIVKDFVSSNPSKAFTMSFGDAALLACISQGNSYPRHQRLFCGLDGIYCIFLGSLNNLCSLNKQYGLSKSTNEAMFIIEAYRTLRDRGPVPSSQGSSGYGWQGANEGAELFWGVAADGSVVISDNLEVIKGSCAKSFAPFPPACMFHSEQGLMSFEHPSRKMKAFPRIDSEGTMCGANFKVDVHSRIGSMPRVGSEANWALGGSRA